MLLGAVPDLGQTGVIEHLHRLQIAAGHGGLGLLELLGQRGPTGPARRRIQRIEVKADGFAIALGMGTPLTLGQHLALVVFFDQHVTVRSGALVMRQLVIR
ncbi:hypothetical protein D3C78_1147620 [compost metagenome]